MRLEVVPFSCEKCPKPFLQPTTLSQMICHQDKSHHYYSSHPFVPSMPTSCAAAASNDAKISLSVNLCGNRGKEPSLIGAWPLVGKLEWNWKEQMKVDANSYESIGFLTFDAVFLSRRSDANVMQTCKFHYRFCHQGESRW